MQQSESRDSANRPTTKPAASKADRLIKLLSRPQGATLAALMKASGWQSHSVRGFLSGTIKKKYQRDLTSSVEGKHRVYRLAAKAETGA